MRLELHFLHRTNVDILRTVPVTSDEKVHSCCVQVVYRSCNLYRPRGFQLAKYRAVCPNRNHRQLHVLSCHSVDESRVLRRTIALKSSRLDCRIYLRKQPREITQLDPVDSSFDRTARGMSHYQDDLRSSRLARELHAAKDVVVRDIARDTGVEHVANAEIHDDLGRCTRVDTTQNDGSGVLALGCGILLRDVVAREPVAFAKALVTLLHESDNLLWGH